MKKIFCLLACIDITIISNCQNKDYYIPLEITYYRVHKYRIPIAKNGTKYELKDTIYDDYWIHMLNYPSTNPRQSAALRQTNKPQYDGLSQKVLFTRKGCDSLINDYVGRASKIDNWSTFGNGAYKENKKNPNNDTYWRCVCIPANELVDIPHRQKIDMGDVYKYFKPKEFCAKFGRYGIDSLNLEEAPYYTIFPMDINPSFRCSKATTPIEKAICRNKQLAELDRELLQVYKLAFKNKGETIKTDQKQWLNEMESICKGKSNDEITTILISNYKTRIDQLR